MQIFRNEMSRCIDSVSLHHLSPRHFKVAFDMLPFQINSTAASRTASTPIQNGLFATSSKKD